MYRIIQSFKPGEVSPEESNRTGYELAMKYTRGQHQFVVATHVDKAHIHTHIEINSTNLNCDGKLRDVKQSAFLLRLLNVELCRAHGPSVIENPKPSAIVDELEINHFLSNSHSTVLQTWTNDFPAFGFERFIVR